MVIKGDSGCVSGNDGDDDDRDDHLHLQKHVMLKMMTIIIGNNGVMLIVTMVKMATTVSTYSQCQAMQLKNDVANQ